MGRENRILIGKVTCILSVIPVLIYAYAGGPPPRHTGVPGENTCAVSGCHVGTQVNTGGGKVEVSFPGGLTYTPGVKQRLTVTVTDPAAAVFGFQMTARLASDLARGQAGDFSPAEQNIIVFCDDHSPKPAAGCRANLEVQSVSHELPRNTGTFAIDWTPPASDVGEVRIFVAGNGANGNGQNTGDRIYTANYTLTPAAAAPKPSIRSELPILQAFSGAPGLSPGTWLEIYGSNLSSTTREWAGGDFTGNTAPTKLDNVSVTIDGKPAFVRYISPTQVNVQAPDGIGVGSGISVVVTNQNGASDPVTIPAAKVSPALLTTPLFNIGGRQYLAALFPDFQTFVGKPNMIAGVPFRPAKPGDTIIVFAVGCGATNPASPAGQFFPEARPLASPFQIRFADVAATQAAGNLAGGAVGLCQFNVTVPNLPSGDVRIDATVDGIATGQTLFTVIE